MRLIDRAVACHVDFDRHHAVLAVNPPDVVNHPLVGSAGAVGLGPARAQVGEDLPLQAWRRRVRLGGGAKFRLFACAVILLVGLPARTAAAHVFQL